MLKGGSRRSQSPTCWVVGELKMNRAKEESAKKTCREDESVASESWLPDQFYFTKSFPGLQQLYCILKHTDDGDVGALTVVVSGFPLQCSLCLVSDILVFTLAEVVLSVQFRGPDVGGCVYHRSCRQTGLELKKKNFIERMCDDKVSANRGPIRRRTASWLLTKTIKTNSNLNSGLHRVCVAATL